MHHNTHDLKDPGDQVDGLPVHGVSLQQKRYPIREDIQQRQTENHKDDLAGDALRGFQNLIPKRPNGTEDEKQQYLCRSVRHLLHLVQR